MPGALTQKTSVGAVATFQVKDKGGALYRLRGFNESGSDVKILLFDKDTTPSAGDQPVFAISAFNGQHFDFSDYDYPIFFENGIFVVVSTTGNTYTVSALTATFLAQYV